jgi:hypothetical protein
MNTFFIATFCAVAVNLLLLVAAVHVADAKVWVKFGRTLRFSIARRALNLITVTASLLLLLLMILIVVGTIHPREGAVYGMVEFLEGRRFGSALLGFLFGTLLVFWTRQLILLKADKPVTWVHRAEAVLLVALLAFGGFSDVISSYVARITQFSAAGVSLTFDPLKTANSTARGQPNSVSGQKASLGALDFLAGMKDFVGRDQKYIELLSNPSGTTPSRSDPACQKMSFPSQKMPFPRSSEILPTASVRSRQRPGTTPTSTGGLSRCNQFSANWWQPAQ